MNKKQIYHIIEWVIAGAACGFLVWKIATYDDYASLWACLCGMGWQQWVAIGVCVALMPVNMAIEAWRWRTLIPMSFHEAQRQVYYSKLAGLITPWRLGEYPARGVLMEGQRDKGQSTKELWAKVLSMGAIGSATMTAAIVAAGAIALPLEIGNWTLENEYLYLIVAVTVLLGAALYSAPRLLRRWAVVSHRLVAVSLGQSFVRLACWCVQLGLVLWALGGIGGIGGLGNLGNLGVLGRTLTYYLFVTVTPNVPIAEAGVRGAWAIVVFGSMNAAMAGVLLWVINTLLPCLIWPFLRKK